MAPDTVVRVVPDTGFTIQFQPDQAPAGITHVYAFSEDAAGNVADLLALAGRPPEMMAAGLYQQPRLPAQDSFHLDPGSRRERISLYLAKGPVPALEALRASPVPASPNPHLAALPRAVIAAGQGRLADLMPGGKAVLVRDLHPPFDRLLHGAESAPAQAADEAQFVTCSFNLDLE